MAGEVLFEVQLEVERYVIALARAGAVANSVVWCSRLVHGRVSKVESMGTTAQNGRWRVQDSLCDSEFLRGFPIFPGRTAAEGAAGTVFDVDL